MDRLTHQAKVDAKLRNLHGPQFIDAALQIYHYGLPKTGSYVDKSNEPWTPDEDDMILKGKHPRGRSEPAIAIRYSRIVDKFTEQDIQNIAANVKRLRNNNKLSQKDLANKANIGERTVRRIENAEPATRTVIKFIATALQTTIENLTKLQE